MVHSHVMIIFGILLQLVKANQVHILLWLLVVQCVIELPPCLCCPQVLTRLVVQCRKTTNFMVQECSPMPLGDELPEEAA